MTARTVMLVDEIDASAVGEVRAMKQALAAIS